MYTAALPAPTATKALAEPALVVKALLVTLPVTSFLALPFIQGSTPANLFAYLILFPLSGLLLLPGSHYAQLIRGMVWWLSVIVALFLLSRLSHINGLVHGMEQLNVINARSPLPTISLSNITQTLYLISGLVVFKLTASQYRPAWDRWIFAGAWFMLIYGFMDWAAESFFRFNLDFLSNRTFKDGAGVDFPGSLRQHLPLMGWQMMRFKSFTGEASMYAITTLPYLYLAIVRGHHKLTGMLVLSLVLTMSTVAYSGLIALGLFLTFRLKRPQPSVYLALLLGLCGLVALVFFNFDGIKSLVDSVFVSKLSGSHVSGAERGSAFQSNIDYWAAPDTSWLVRLFGLGFGTIRSTDLVSTLLVNVGLVGCAATLGWILSLLGAAWTAHKRLGMALFASIFLLMLGAVPEFAYLPPWLLAGLLASDAFKESA